MAFSPDQGPALLERQPATNPFARVHELAQNAAHNIMTKAVNFHADATRRLEEATLPQGAVAYVAMGAAALGGGIAASPASGSSIEDCTDPYAICGDEGPPKPSSSDKRLVHSIKVEQWIGGQKYDPHKRIVSTNEGLAATMKIKIKPRSSALPRKKYPRGRSVVVFGNDGCGLEDKTPRKRVRLRRGKTATVTYKQLCETDTQADGYFSINVGGKNKDGYSVILKKRNVKTTKATPAEFIQFRIPTS